MTRVLLKKGIILLFSLFAVATLTFFLMHAIPGDPFTQDKAVHEEILQSMYRHYGLDQPLIVQYGKYLQGLFTWELGPSFKYEGRTVNAIIGEGFPVSLMLGCEALFIAVIAALLVWQAFNVFVFPAVWSREAEERMIQEELRRQQH